MPCLQDTGAGHRQGVRAWTRKPAVQCGPQAREVRCRALPCHGVRRDHACPLLRSSSTCEATSVYYHCMLLPARQQARVTGLTGWEHGAPLPHHENSWLLTSETNANPMHVGLLLLLQSGETGRASGALAATNTDDQIPVNSMAPSKAPFGFVFVKV